MNLITQPNNWTCAAACVCMLTGTTLEDFYAFCGHDGSENVPITTAWPIGRRCFSHQELAGYLLRHNMMQGWGCKPAGGFNPKTHQIEAVDFEHMPALVDVQSTTPGMIHCVLWDTERIIDPYFPERRVKLEEYEVNAWWPITKLPPVGESHRA